ncbi:MAG: S-layer homology domain-containing protein [Clostridia bacterium]|nr:S-layer homology domain-containing protein [Clostridia bacterium]
MRKMMYKALALMLSLTLFCTGIVAVQAAETEADGNFAPMTTLEFDALSTMGLLTEDFLTMSADAQVSRAQFIGGLYKMAGFSEDSVMLDVPFNDVSKDTPYANAIAYFYNAGYISGTSATTFSPNDKITYAQALKIMVDLLGYKDITLKTMGAYPTGYLNMATKLELFDGLSIKSFDGAVSGDAAVVLFYNYGITPIVEDVVYSSDGTITYSSSKGRYPLSVYHKIYFAKGKMNDNGVVSLLGADSSNDAVVIGETTYKADGVNCQPYLGCTVNYFYKVTDAAPVLLWLMQDDETKALTLLKNDLATNDEKYGFTNLVYYKNDQKMDAEIDLYADFVYNNQLYNSLTLEQLKIEAGEIKLINNDSDKDYDLVIIEEFTNYFLSIVSVEKEYLMDKYGKTLNLKEFDNVFYIKDGKYITLDEISIARIASCVESANKKHLYVYVNDVGVGEKLKTIKTVNGEKYYEFESGTYKKAHSLKTTTYSVPEMKAGSSYKYFLDKAGDIAAVELLDAGAIQYAMLLDTNSHTEIFEATPRAMVKLMLSDGTVVSTQTAEKVVIDDNPATTNVTAILNATKEQVVKVAFNSDGELRKIDFADSLEPGRLIDTTKFTLDYENAKVMYRDYIINSTHALTPNTVMFAKYIWNGRDKEYKVLPLKDLVNAKYINNVKIYDCNEYREAGVVTLELDVATNFGYPVYVLVDEVETTLDADGEPKIGMSVIQLGNETHYEVDKTTKLTGASSLEDIKRGDVLSMLLLGNTIYSIDRIASLSDRSTFINSDGTLLVDDIPADAGDKQRSYALGYYYSNGLTGLALYNPNGWGKGSNGKILMARSTTTAVNTKMGVYDAKADKIYIGDIDDLYQNSAPQADGSLTVNDESTMVFLYRDGYNVSTIFAIYY